MEQLQKDAMEARRALVEAAFNFTNAVNASEPPEVVAGLEERLTVVARGYATTMDAVIDAMRPVPPRRPRRR